MTIDIDEDDSMLFYEDDELELDFCIALAMFEGKEYDDAVEQAKEWVKEANEDTHLTDEEIESVK